MLSIPIIDHYGINITKTRDWSGLSMTCFSTQGLRRELDVMDDAGVERASSTSRRVNSTTTRVGLGHEAQNTGPISAGSPGMTRAGCFHGLFRNQLLCLVD
jgi:hypothetical protein